MFSFDSYNKFSQEKHQKHHLNQTRVLQGDVEIWVTSAHVVGPFQNISVVETSRLDYRIPVHSIKPPRVRDPRSAVTLFTQYCIIYVPAVPAVASRLDIITGSPKYVIVINSHRNPSTSFTYSCIIFVPAVASRFCIPDTGTTKSNIQVTQLNLLFCTKHFVNMISFIVKIKSVKTTCTRISYLQQYNFFTSFKKQLNKSSPLCIYPHMNSAR